MHQADCARFLLIHQMLAARVNREITSIMALPGAPPACWAIFENGTTVMYVPTDADVSLAFEAQRYLRRKLPLCALEVNACLHNRFCWVFFEKSDCGASVFSVRARTGDEDVLDAVRGGLRARALDSSGKVVCTSCNFIQETT